MKKLETLKRLYNNLKLGDKIIIFNYMIIISVIIGLVLSINNINNIKVFIIYIFITLILSIINNILLTIKHN